MIKFLNIFFVLLVSVTSWAHSGGTNSAGCHHDRKNGGYHCHRSETETRTVSSATTEDYQVSYNQKSGVYHRPNCKSAKSCTVNCIPVSKSEAIERGARPCGNCGG